jgi:hypothetical protein
MTPAEVLELNIVNAALGLAAVICIAVVAWGVVSEVAVRLRARWAATADTHAFALPELGLTMADGGEKVDEEKKKD